MSEITSKIATFPDDDKERVVWWYGATYLEKTTNPEVEVALRIIKKDKTLSEEASIYRVSVTDLCIVRIGSIWKGQSATSNYWNNTESLQFEFDLSVKKCKVINCFSRDSTLSGMDRTYIPVEKYSLRSIPSSVRRYDLNFLNSKLTVLTSLDGKKVVIPCLELLTSTFTPQEMDIRRQLLTKSIDKLLEQYTEPKWCEEKDGEYHVFMREPKAPSNITFLSYLALNPTTRKAVSKIYSQIQAEEKGKYPQRFPAIEPWQPDKLKIKVEGLWVKSNYTFLVLRINGYSLPIDKAIVENVYQNIVEESEAKGNSALFINGDKTVSLQHPKTSRQLFQNSYFFSLSRFH